MKGKKFDAAEKYFLKKEINLRLEMRKNNELVEKVLKENETLLKENKALKEENTEIREKFDKLLEYSKLSENDIITALHKDKVMTQFGSMLGVAGRYL